MNLGKNFRREVLSNGMVLLFEKRELPITSIAFAVKQGGINESLDEKGISHFIEHMLFKGTSSRTALQISKEIEKKGGEINGFTSEEATAVWCKIPSVHTDVGLDVLTDIIKNSLFVEEELNKERKVIFEEIKMIEDNPSQYVLDRIKGCLYKPPFGRSLIGTFETMNSIDRKNLFSKFKKTYVPNNLILIVVGNYDFEKLKRFAEENFGKDKRMSSSFKVEKKNGFKVETRKGVGQANLVFAFHSPLRKDKKSFAAQVLISLMAEGMSSRLFSEIRTKRNLAYSIFGGLDLGLKYSHSFIYVGTTKKEFEEVKKIILDEFRIVSKFLDEEELEQVKNQLIGNHQISMEDSEMQMVNLLSYEIGGDATDFYSYEKNISKVKLKDVKELASRVKEGNYSFFALLPED